MTKENEVDREVRSFEILALFNAAQANRLVRFYRECPAEEWVERYPEIVDRNGLIIPQPEDLAEAKRLVSTKRICTTEQLDD